MIILKPQKDRNLHIFLSSLYLKFCFYCSLHHESNVLKMLVSVNLMNKDVNNVAT